MADDGVSFWHRRQTLLPQGRLPVIASRAIHDGVYAAHDHDFMEIAVVTAGTGTHESVVGRQQVGPGDVVVLRPGAWHAYQDAHDLHVYNVCFGPEMLQNELAWTLADPATGSLLWGGPLAADRMGVTMHRLQDVALHRCEALLNDLEAVAPAWAPPTISPRPTRVMARLLLFLDELASETWHWQDDQSAPGQAAAHPPVHSAVLAAVRALDLNLQHPWTSEELAEEVGVDFSYLGRLFKKAMGLSPWAYLSRQRAERAAQLLIRTSKPIGTIAGDVGWPAHYYFARRFKAHFGMTAAEYRRRFTKRPAEESAAPAEGD